MTGAVLTDDASSEWPCVCERMWNKETRVHKGPRGLRCAEPGRGPPRARCVFSAAGKGGGGRRSSVGAFCLRSLMLPASPERSDGRHAGCTRDTRSHDNCLTHIHTLAARDTHGLPSAVGRGHIPPQSASLLLLIVLRELIHIQNR